tara:strand:+ start:1548 stop:1868 length:321 start_codon:yes stop_codon:yes gene_type:complete
MAMGSYTLGATVRIPLQVTDSGVPFSEEIYPTIKQIIKPDRTSAYAASKPMVELDRDYGTYYYDYKPDLIGDYVVIITYTFEDVEFSVIENFTVGSIVSIPRAEAR